MVLTLVGASTAASFGLLGISIAPRTVGATDGDTSGIGVGFDVVTAGNFVGDGRGTGIGARAGTVTVGVRGVVAVLSGAAVGGGNAATNGDDTGVFISIPSGDETPLSSPLSSIHAIKI